MRGESFQTHISLQNFVSIKPRTSPVEFAASRANRPENSPLSSRSLRSDLAGVEAGALVVLGELEGAVRLEEPQELVPINLIH